MVVAAMVAALLLPFSRSSFPSSFSLALALLTPAETSA
jgi:hypothetical protein